MGAKIGNKNIASIFHGDTEIVKVFRGDDLIFVSTETPFIAIGGTGTNLFLLDSELSNIWTVTFATAINDLKFTDSYIYVARDRAIEKLDYDGNILLTYNEPNNKSINSLDILNDEVYFGINDFGSGNPYLRKLDSSFQTVWTTTPTDDVTRLVIHNNNIYLGTRSTNAKYNLSGQLQWENTGTGFTRGIDILDNHVYFATFSGIRKTDFNGNNIWTSTSKLYWTIKIYDDLIYAVNLDNEIDIIDLNGSIVSSDLQSFTVRFINIFDNFIYVGGVNNLYKYNLNLNLLETKELTNLGVTQALEIKI
jgi:hypothetical protein